MADPTTTHLIEGELPDHSLASPFVRLDANRATQIARENWGIAADSLRRFDTERDDTFLVLSSGEPHVLKVSHPLDDQSVIELQCSALSHAARNDPSLPLPRLVPSLQGISLPIVDGAQAEPRIARLLTYLPGSTLDYDNTSAAQRRAVGIVVARLSLALADFEHPAASRYLHFDLKQLGGLRPLLVHVGDPGTRDDVERILDAYDSHIGAELAATRQQVVHHDINADNVLADQRLDEFVTGILDFGDVVHSSVIGDLAVAMSYAVSAGQNATLGRDEVDPWDAPYDLAAGFESIRSLTDNELELLPDLVRARLAQRLLLNSWLAASDPGNAHYTGRTISWTSQTLHRLLNAATPHRPGHPQTRLT